jgi:hypothetical protein
MTAPTAGVEERELVVTISRDLARRLVDALTKANTKAGHLAQRVSHEHLGYCSWRSESSLCIDHRALIDELKASVGAGPVALRRVG